MKLRLKVGDWMLAGLLVLVMIGLPLIITGDDTGKSSAIVTQDGDVIARIRLSGLQGPVRVAYEGEYAGEILAEDGRVRFEHANCPDQICVHTGWLTKPGQLAACLPARVLVQLEGETTGDEDVRLR